MQSIDETLERDQLHAHATITLDDGTYSVIQPGQPPAHVSRFVGQELLAICSCGGMVDTRFAADECQHIAAVEVTVLARATVRPRQHDTTPGDIAPATNHRRKR